VTPAELAEPEVTAGEKRTQPSSPANAYPLRRFDSDSARALAVPDSPSRSRHRRKSSWAEPRLPLWQRLAHCSVSTWVGSLPTPRAPAPAAGPPPRER